MPSPLTYHIVPEYLPRPASPPFLSHPAYIQYNKEQYQIGRRGRSLPDGPYVRYDATLTLWVFPRGVAWPDHRFGVGVPIVAYVLLCTRVCILVSVCM